MNRTLEKTERPYNNTEINDLKNRKYSLWNHFENFGKKWIILTIISIVPFLLYEKFIKEVPPETELLIVVVLQLITVIIILYIMNRMGELNWNKKVEDEIKKGKAQVLKIKTDKVIKRKEIYDLGSGFYIKISENETLYLQGQYFDELQYLKKFPNTDFEIVRTKLNFNELININSFGEYLKPERKLRAFTKEEYEKEDVHYDGDLLKISIDEIK